MNRRKWTVGAIAVATMLAAGGVAYATIPDSNSVIHSCYTTKGGSLRVIDPGAGESCNLKESPLDWNGLEETSRTVSLPPGGWIVNVDCPTGKLAISGGWELGTQPGIDVQTSSPYKDDSGWTFVFINTTSSTTTITAYAMCANAQ